MIEMCTWSPHFTWNIYMVSSYVILVLFLVSCKSAVFHMAVYVFCNLFWKICPLFGQVLITCLKCSRLLFVFRLLLIAKRCAGVEVDLWWKENLVKYKKFWKYYDHGCLKNFLLLFMSLLTVPYFGWNLLYLSKRMS